MKPIQVEKNECRTVTTPGAALVAHNVGEEIVVTLYDAETRVGGIVRFTQPDSKADAGHAKQMPATYADSGIAALIAEASRQGADKKRASVHIVGGAHLTQAEAAIKKNYLAARKSLWKIGLVIESEAVGGVVPRHVHLEIGEGGFSVHEAEDNEGESARSETTPNGGTNLCLTVY